MGSPSVSAEASAKPQLVSGGVAVDDRGIVMFANDFDFAGVRRFYVLENFATSTVRAFHGHLKERKGSLVVVAGSAIVAAVRINDTAHPDRAEHVERFVLSVRKPAVLRIPAG